MLEKIRIKYYKKKLEYIRATHAIKKEIYKLNTSEYDAQTEMKTSKHRLTMSKILILFILLNCTIVEIYSMIAMYVKDDLTVLNTLIASVVGESVSFAIYAIKAYMETKSEKELEFEIEKFEKSKLLHEEQENNTTDESED